jgi:S-adenosylmethionine:tRNA ribosyltransferase-isomerase
MRLTDFGYDLPGELIAQEPAEKRDGSRLMVVRRESESLAHHHFPDLVHLLPEGSLLVLNDTRVFLARLKGRKETGGEVEILLLHPFVQTRHVASLQDRRQPEAGEVWEVMVRAATRPRQGERVVFAPQLWGEWEQEALGGRCRLRFFAQEDLFSVLERIGEVPLPPYIKRPEGLFPSDRDRYQTVYAKKVGSVAAPTAGLHFTPELLETLQRQGIEVLFLTLHVGPGTFQPIRTEVVETHVMEGEEYEISVEIADRINLVKAGGRKIIAVGTSTTRALESAGVQGVETRHVASVRPGRARTDLFIYPGYTFKIVGGLLTNFHPPRSTSLLLISAFAGRDLILRAYEEAMAQGYRFLSYGDAMLIV